MTVQLATPYLRRAGEGEGIWFLNTLFTVKAGAVDAEGAFTFMEQLCPPGFAPPPHVHHAETEAFYMLDGTMTVTCGSVHDELRPGDFLLLPRGIPHGFAVPWSGPARFIHLTAPGQFDHFAREVGEPATELVIPAPKDPDVETLLEVAARYQLGILSE
jgi:mannose-6-phosphate isomerase-like protein (cupin superfamily)